MAETDTPTTSQAITQPGGANPEARFTQEDVNRIVGERLSRETTKYADYNTLREKAAKADELNSKFLETDTKLKTTETALEGVLNTYLLKIPEDKKALIPADYSTIKKLEYIEANKATFTTIVEIPKKLDAPAGANADFGGYDSITEFAQKDPRAFKKSNYYLK